MFLKEMNLFDDFFFTELAKKIRVKSSPPLQYLLHRLMWLRPFFLSMTSIQSCIFKCFLSPSSSGSLQYFHHLSSFIAWWKEITKSYLDPKTSTWKHNINIQKYSDKKANFSFLLLAPYFWSKYYQPALLFPIFVLTLHTTRGPKNGSHSNCKGPNSRDINSHFVIQTIQPSLLLQLCYFMQKYSIR